MNNKIIESFVDKLKHLSKADISRLKKAGTEPSNDIRLYDLFSKLEIGVPGWATDIFDLIAVLFAIGKDCKISDDKNYNIGEHLKNAEFSEIRMKALLNTNRENLFFRMRQVIKYLGKELRPVNWEILTDDLLNWKHKDHYIQRKWAKGYYTNTKITEEKEHVS